MKTYLTTAVTILAVLMLSSGGLLVTHAATGSQPLNIGLQGGVFSVGNQHYVISQSGPASLYSYAIIGGDFVAPTQISYSLDAQQNALVTSGEATFSLQGIDINTSLPVSVTGIVQISGSVPALYLPANCTNTHSTNDRGNVIGNGAKCTSEVPAAFTGGALVSIGATQTVVGMILESAYFNPFGNPIVIASTDGSIVIVTTYQAATIDWTNGVNVGGFAGTLGSTSITGTFQQVATEHEDLYAGTATDSGVFSFSNVATSTGSKLMYMDASGTYSGTSTIPTGTIDCSAMFNIPGITGICTETGFNDIGTFSVAGSHAHTTASIIGSYAVTWTTPAFAFAGSVTGTVTQ